MLNRKNVSSTRIKINVNKIEKKIKERKNSTGRKNMKEAKQNRKKRREKNYSKIKIRK